MGEVAGHVLPLPPGDDKPRTIVAPVALGDRIFRGILRGSGLVVFGITAAILVFLSIQAAPALKVAGFGFFTTPTWFSNGKSFGVAALVPYSALIAAIALVIAIPVGIATALFISEYAPPRLRKALISVIDLMAAVPSIVIALFGLYYLMPRILGFDGWLARHLGWIPIFHFRLPFDPSSFVGSSFIAGVVVSLLVIPIITSLSRQVFSQAPPGEREAAYALGSTRWGMIRAVVLPYGRAGMIGASMLGLGRALGETIAVSFILTPVFTFNYHILEQSGNSVTYEIANHLLDNGKLGQSALMAAGLVLFVMTLGINTIAAIIISRSRSGAGASAD